MNRVKNTTVLNIEEAFGADQLLKLTAQVYLNEALVNQAFESCRELIDTAKKLGVAQSDISATIADYLNSANGPKRKADRFRL